MRPIDLKILKLIDYLKQSGQIRFTQEFIDAIGIHKQHIRLVRTGHQSFTVEQIHKICMTYGVEPNAFFVIPANKIKISKIPKT